MKSFIVKTITRAHSSGYENSHTESFPTLEEASAYIQKYIKGLYIDYDWPESWDADDFDGEPCPTPELASVERLRELLNTTGPGCEAVVWGPESNFCYLVPDEILITETN